MRSITPTIIAYIGGVRRYRGRAVAAGALVATVLTMAACSSKPPAPPQTSTTTTAQAAPSTPPLQLGISPNGVTTSISAPASSTEEEYYLACHWARLWMSGQPGDPHAQIEPYLAMLQHSPNGENGTWQTPWAKLSPERQSAVIVAANAAADAGCD
jgi:Putative lipoprotein LpqV